MTDRLDSSYLNSAVQNTIFAEKIHVFPSLDSTNTFAMAEAANGALHGSVYVAEEQTAGRGRGAHAWHSEPHAGLYLSILLRPRMVPADALWFSLATGLAVQQAIANVTNLVADVRWPNDLLLSGRKFGGILTEMNAEPTRVRFAVIGIGVNIGHGNFPADLRQVATSLRLESQQAPSRQQVLIEILRTMNSELQPLLQADNFGIATASILDRIEIKSTWIRGKRVFVDEAEGYTGVTDGLDARGFLRVNTDAGIRIVLSGGVREDKQAGRIPDVAGH